VDYVVYVGAAEAARAVRTERDAARGWGMDEIARRERFMAERGGKMKKSDIVLENDGDIEKWERAAREFGGRLLAMSSVCEFSTCCASLDDAERIASILVEGHLAAGVNISEVKSCFYWKGAVSRMPEWRMTCTTTGSALRSALECIRENHPYELPAITAAELSRSDPETLMWVVDSCV
jgi:periplasmic divalent cation tolerance protein